MKANTLAAIVILLTAVTFGYASADKPVRRPPGIAADEWYPIGDRLGLVVSDYQPGLDLLIDNGPVRAVPRAELPPPRPSINPTPPSAARNAAPPASAVPAIRGYLMIEYGGHWTRLSLVSPPIFPPRTGAGRSQ